MTIQLPSGSSFLLKVEDGFTAKPFEAIADDGGHQTFSCTGTRFSLCEKDENGVDRRPVVAPDGVMNGCFVSPAVSGQANAIDLSAGTLLIGGAMININPAVNVALTRPASGLCRAVSITLTNSGALAMVAGTDGAAFSATRGAAGGPPWVPVGSIELAIVGLAATAAPLADGDIAFAPEYSHAPEYTLLPYTASVRFAAPLAAIHTGAMPRTVWVKWSEPAMATMDAILFRPPVAQHEMDPATMRPVARRIRPGVARWVLSGNAGDLARKAARGPRLYQFQSDAATQRADLFYAHAETTADYRPIDIVEGEALLFPVEFPVTI